jgi:hypothetical protein
MVPSYQDRKRHQNQRGNQTASPPTIFFQYLLLETVEARFEAAFRGLSLISRATWFFRHKRLPRSFFLFRGAIIESTGPAAPLPQNY